MFGETADAYLNQRIGAAHSEAAKKLAAHTALKEILDDEPPPSIKNEKPKPVEKGYKDPAQVFAREGKK